MLPTRCKCNGIVTYLVRASFLRTYSTTVHPRVKLSEVPGVCSSEEWNSVIQESQVVLQRIVSPVRHKVDRTNVLPMHTVIRRLEESSRNSSYLINTFRQLLANSETNVTELRWPGLVSLMLSIGIGNPFETNNFVCKALEEVIWSSQITLAEAMNLMYCNFLFQKEYQRFASSKTTATKHAVSENQIHRLINNYFTSSTLQRISCLENDKVLFLFSKVLESFVIARSSNSPDSVTIHNLTAWEHDTFYPLGLLIATGCQSALELAGHGEKIQQSGFEFGRCFALAIKANADIRQFWNYQASLSSIINISSLPVALHLTNNPETLAYLYSCKQTLLNLDYNELNNILMNNAAMEDARLQLTTYVEKATNVLQEFQSFKNYELIELLLKLVKTLENTDR